jgi:hypothetical protein
MQKALAEPFPAGDVGYKPQTVKGERALVVWYIDARNVMDRLDAVFGIEGWQDSYVVLADGNVQCSLACRIGEEWVVKCDVGGESDQKDEGDKRKSAYSDALKRAAVKWGVGRYLYDLPLTWHDYDPQRHQFRSKPLLPDWALPKQRNDEQTAKPQPVTPTTPPTAPPTPARSTNGTPPAAPPPASLGKRLLAGEAQRVGQGRCVDGELTRWVRGRSWAKGLPADMNEWPSSVADHVKAAVSEFDATRHDDCAVSFAQAQALADELARTGVAWAAVLKDPRMPDADPDADLTVNTVSQAQWRYVMGRLRETATKVRGPGVPADEVEHEEVEEEVEI